MGNNFKIILLKEKDKNFNQICYYCEQNINRENHSKNGGTLNYEDLTYDSDILIVALINDIPVAYNSLRFNKEGTLLYIYQIAVKKEYQGKGIGKTIMSEAIRIARKLNMDVSGHVKDYNIASKRMFESLGFKKIDLYSTVDNNYYLLKQRRLSFKETINNLKRK